MPLLDQKPNPFQRRQTTLSADALNTMRQALLRQIRGGDGTDVGYYGDRVVIDSQVRGQPQTPDPGNYLAQFVVLQELDDMLKCAQFRPPFDSTKGQWQPQKYDATLGDSDITTLYIAKPYTLQKTPWVGTGKYTDANSITPAYVAGEVITAVRAASGYVSPDDGSQLVWMDANTSGRAAAGSMSVAGLNPSSGPFTATTVFVDQSTGIEVVIGDGTTYPDGDLVIYLQQAYENNWGVVSPNAQIWFGNKAFGGVISSLCPGSLFDNTLPLGSENRPYFFLSGPGGEPYLTDPDFILWSSDSRIWFGRPADPVAHTFYYSTWMDSTKIRTFVDSGKFQIEWGQTLDGLVERNYLCATSIAGASIKPCYAVDDVSGAGFLLGRWGTNFSGAVVSGGIVTTLDTYTPGTLSNWAGSVAPTSLADALDRIAAALTALGHSP